MDTMGVRVLAIGALLCVVSPLHLMAADQCGGEDDGMAVATEMALIAEIFGDDQEIQNWGVAEPRYDIEMELAVDNVRSRFDDGESSCDVRFIAVNNDVLLFISEARESCE